MLELFVVARGDEVKYAADRLSALSEDGLSAYGEGYAGTMIVGEVDRLRPGHTAHFDGFHYRIAWFPQRTAHGVL